MPMTRIDPETAPAHVRLLLRLEDGDVAATLARAREGYQQLLAAGVTNPGRERLRQKYERAIATLEELLAR